MRKLREIEKIEDVLSLVKSRGDLEAVFFDIDNTLTASHSPTIGQEVRQLINDLKELGIKMALISNNNRERVEKFAKTIELPCYWHAKKPLPFTMLRATRDLQVSPARSLFVGDQIITDIIAAYLAGIEAVLVFPYSKSSDGAWQNFFSRRIERHIFKRKI